MNSVQTERRELEHHQLERRFAALRLPDARALERLSRSLERSGQLSPCIAVAEADSLVLLDGYRRLAALHRLGRDTVWVQLWHCPLPEALARLLAGTAGRAFAPLEEALLLRELATDGELSQHELARRTGRDVSWVNRRLQLLSALSDELLEAVCAGRLSSWAAVRIFAPLARANTEHAHALLATEHQLPLAYSTLTRWVREAELRGPARRAGSYTFEPGQEMHHDTSPHRVVIAGQSLTAQCASLVLAYSRRLFVRYYPRFTRFEAKAFLAEAFVFFDGTCPRCVIDNTSALLVSGAGAEATFAPEMVAFARAYGVTFWAHAVGHSDRKARVERPFAYIEGNFLAGRTFEDWDDLNAQALAWCVDTANAKPKRALGMSPEAAYVLERPYLIDLPEHRPPVYQAFERIVDVTGFVSLDTNRYSVPERFVGKQVTVYKYPGEVQVHLGQRHLATHPRLVGQRDAKRTLPGHHSVPVLFPALDCISPACSGRIRSPVSVVGR